MKGIFSYGLATIIERFLSFLLVPLLTNFVSKEEYAIWSQIIIITSLLSQGSLLGFSQSTIKFLPEFEKNKNLLNSFTLFIVLTPLIIIMIIASIIFFMNDNFSILFFNDLKNKKFLFPLLFCTISETFFDLIGVSLLRAKKLINKCSFYLIVKSSVRIGFMFFFLVILNQGFFKSVLIFSLVQVAFVLTIVFIELNFKEIIKSTFKPIKPKILSIFKFSLPLAFYSFTVFLNNFLDRFIISHFLGLEQLALYAATFSFCALSVFFYSVIGFTLFPHLSDLIAKKNYQLAADLMTKSFSVYVAFILPFVLTTSFIGSNTLSIFSGSNFFVPNSLFFALSTSLGLFGCFQIFIYPYIIINGTLKLPLLLIVSVIINIFVNLITLPILGILGSGIAQICSNLFLSFYLFFLSKKSINWTPNYYFIFLAFVKTFLLYLFIMAFISFFDMNSIVNFATFIIIILVLFLILDLATKNNSVIKILRSF